MEEGARLTVAEAEALYPIGETVIGTREVVDEETQLTARGNSANASTIIDATEGRRLFPLRTEPRSFASRSALTRTMIDELGGEEFEGDDGVPNVRGSYAMFGSSYWTDPGTDVEYRVSDPIAAWLGGSSGIVLIDGSETCIDPDGDCNQNEVASYLEPQGVPTQVQTHAWIQGTNDVVAHFHTCFNKVYFPWPWARHCSRTEINFAALPETMLFADGWIWTDTSTWGWVASGMPSESANHHEVETALWTASAGNYTFDAEAACGLGLAQDPDVTGSRCTGNGPQGPSLCPPVSCF